MPVAEPQSNGSPDPLRGSSVGDRVQPANRGNLGYLYTIYRFYDVDDRLIYLGRSERIRQRIPDLEIGHPRGLPLGHDDGPKPWWREAMRIDLEHLPPGTTEAEARAEERRQIEAFRPAYNREFNLDHFDRPRFERAMDTAHFETDVATFEHERHDGTVRAVERIAIESERAADRIRPTGASRLRYGLRPPVPSLRTSRRGSASASRTASTRGGGRGRWGRFEGPGSVAGIVIIAVLLVAIVIAALVVSFRAVI